MKVSSGLVSLALCGTIQGFIPCSRSNRSIRLSNGGKGWDNDSYLNNLGGTEEDRERAKNEYKEFQESRQAFLERQKSLTDNSRVQQFMQERSRMESIQWEENPVDEMTESNQQGGSRFYRMMQQSKNRQTQDRFGFEQKFAVPLDFDDEGGD